jgi:hypothetical protein
MNFVARAGLLAILELGLRHRGAEVDVPQRRRFDLVGEPAPAAARTSLRDELRVAANGRVVIDQSTEREIAPQLRTPSRP